MSSLSLSRIAGYLALCWALQLAAMALLRSTLGARTGANDEMERVGGPFRDMSDARLLLVVFVADPIAQAATALALKASQCVTFGHSGSAMSATSARGSDARSAE